MEGIINLFSKPIIKAKQKEKVQPNPNRQVLLDQINATKIQMGAIRCCFDLETNFDLIDSYIMELDSLEKRYSYLLKQAKSEGIVAFQI